MLVNCKQTLCILKTWFKTIILISCWAMSMNLRMVTFLQHQLFTKKWQGGRFLVVWIPDGLFKVYIIFLLAKGEAIAVSGKQGSEFKINRNWRGKWLPPERPMVSPYHAHKEKRSDMWAININSWHSGVLQSWVECDIEELLQALFIRLFTMKFSVLHILPRRPRKTKGKINTYSITHRNSLQYTKVVMYSLIWIAFCWCPLLLWYTAHSK